MSFFSNLSTLFGTPSQPNQQTQKKEFKKPKQKFNKQNKQQPQGKKQQNQPKPAPVIVQPKVDTSEIMREAKAKAREIILEAKDEALALRSKTENQQRQIARQIEDQQRELNRKLDKIDFKLSKIEDKEEKLVKENKIIEKTKKDLDKTRDKVLERLEKVSGMTKDEAKSILVDGVEKKISKQLAQLVRQKEEEAKAQADTKVQEIIVDAMKHGATDYVAEYTVSTVALPSEEAKGKIIGKSGRNIHTFERYTGVDVDLDYSATEVRLSCFDPVRREVARIALQRLIKDGRIQPTRIEEVVDKVRSEIDKITFEAGKKLCFDVGVYNLPNELMKMLGRFKYRFSYGQNLIKHTLEETRIGIKLAHEVGADVNIVKLGCLLHDIGKVSGDEEGSHVELGVKVAKKYNMPQAVVDCIAQHHEDEPFSGVDQMLVYIADAISGARPGARYENHDEYVKRLHALEDIASAYKGVREAYAIQAGREIRVLLNPEITKDDDVTILAVKIRDEIKEKMTYPGTVTVNVIRELRDGKVAT
ncbi:MAG: ribonuclease Y [Candidatus Pacebacteria bacterium]|nr:ribonuclease Y [Candidatus Paceibacterota bacterium]